MIHPSTIYGEKEERKKVLNRIVHCVSKKKIKEAFPLHCFSNFSQQECVYVRVCVCCAACYNLWLYIFTISTRASPFGYCFFFSFFNIFFLHMSTILRCQYTEINFPHKFSFFLLEFGNGADPPSGGRSRRNFTCSFWTFSLHFFRLFEGEIVKVITVMV